MAASRLPADYDAALRNGIADTQDPGDAGTISVSGKGFSKCVVTGGTTRTLESAAAASPGTRVLVMSQTSTITVNSVALADGEYAEFLVTLDSNGANQWVVVYGVANAVTATTAFGTDNVLVRSDGTGRGTQLSGIVLNDADQFTSKLGFLTGAGAAASASGLIMGGGTTANPLLTAAASTNFIEFRAKSTGTGAQRLGYFSYDAGGGGSYECVRGRVQITAAAADATGGSFGVEVNGQTGYVVGSCAALSATSLISDAAVHNAGTYYAAQVSFNGAGASSSLAATTKYAILGIAATGHATFVTSVKNAIAFDGADSSSGGDMISPGSSIGTAEGTIRVLINGVVKYIPWYGHEGHA